MSQGRWLASQQPVYLPSNESFAVTAGRLYYYGPPEAFGALTRAGIQYQEGHHSRYKSLQRVILPQGVKLVAHSSDSKCALLIGIDTQEIARISYKDDSSQWYLRNPGPDTSQRREQTGGGFMDGILNATEGVSDAVGRAVGGAVEVVLEGIETIIDR